MLCSSLIKNAMYSLDQTHLSFQIQCFSYEKCICKIWVLFHTSSSLSTCCTYEMTTRLLHCFSLNQDCFSISNYCASHQQTVLEDMKYILSGRWMADALLVCIKAPSAADGHLIHEARVKLSGIISSNMPVVCLSGAQCQLFQPRYLCYLLV